MEKILKSILEKTGYFKKSKILERNITRINLLERKKIKDKINQCISFESSPSSFLKIHDFCWSEHNFFDYELTLNHNKLNYSFQDLEGIEVITDLFNISVGLDRAKRIVSNSVKEIIENYVVSKKMNSSDINILLSPLTESFYVQYPRDLEILDDFQLAKKYFRGDINMVRTERNFNNSSCAGFSSERNWRYLDRRILLHEKTKLAQIYGKEIFAIDKLLERDHFQEYVYRKGLVGIGDYYLHLLVSDLTGVPIENFETNFKILDTLRKNHREKKYKPYNKLELISKEFKKRYSKLEKYAVYLQKNCFY